MDAGFRRVDKKGTALMAVDRQYFVYILASRKNGTLYIGVTNDLLRRVHEHREGLVPGFTRRYGVKRLVCYETYQEVTDAIHREKVLKE
jgi:putative endonuclease